MPFANPPAPEPSHRNRQACPPGDHHRTHPLTSKGPCLSGSSSLHHHLPDCRSGRSSPVLFISALRFTCICVYVLKKDAAEEVVKMVSRDSLLALMAEPHEQFQPTCTSPQVHILIEFLHQLLLDKLCTTPCLHPCSKSICSSILGCSLHKKEAQKQCFLEETEHDCGSFQNGLDESDWLAELTEIGMLDVFEDVGLSTVQTTCSSQGNNATDLEQR
ncbi:hypothetical protein VPH35_040096 [Triticum aestivum]|uniref:Uncharacterized protein n=1 Tax=Aegilops tauschii TaxID=37682 RepID=N1QXK9_AEGTA